MHLYVYAGREPVVKRTSKNRIAPPRITPDKAPDAVCFGVRLRGKQIVLKPSRIGGSRARLRKVRAKVKVLGLIEKDIDGAVRWARDR